MAETKTQILNFSGLAEMQGVGAFFGQERSKHGR